MMKMRVLMVSNCTRQSNMPNPTRPLKMATIKPMKKTFKVSSKLLINFYYSSIASIISAYLSVGMFTIVSQKNEFICFKIHSTIFFPDLVDYLLDTYDLDSNGILEYPEFMKAFEETRAQLGVS